MSLNTFGFRAAPARHNLMDASAQPRELNCTGARKVPADAPSGFLKPRWERLVFRNGGIERQFYALAAASSGTSMNT